MSRSLRGSGAGVRTCIALQRLCVRDSSLGDVSDDDYFDACELTDLMGVKAIEMIKAKKK